MLASSYCNALKIEECANVVRMYTLQRERQYACSVSSGTDEMKPLYFGKYLNSMR
jgi:hypothetical protein